jgi:vacuolar protein 8
MSGTLPVEGGDGAQLKQLAQIDSGEAKAAAAALWKLAVNADLQAAIAQAGGILVLVSAVSLIDGLGQQSLTCFDSLPLGSYQLQLVHSGSEEAKAQAEEALVNLGTSWIIVLVQLVQSGSEETKSRAAAALWNLASNADNRITIAQAGGIPVSRSPAVISAITPWGSYLP